MVSKAKQKALEQAKAAKVHLSPREKRAKRDLDEVTKAAASLAHPRPWKLVKPGEGSVALLADAFFVVDANESIICRFSFAFGGLEVQLASATLMIDAVNAAAPTCKHNYAPQPMHSNGVIVIACTKCFQEETR